MPAGTNGDCLWILKNDNSPVCRAILATIMRKKLFVGILALALTACCMLTLTGCSVKINSIGLPESEVLEKGDTLALEISYGTENEATEEKLAEAVSKLTLVWASTDEAVATVDETGLVTAVGPGEADVSVSIQDANQSSTCHVVVVVTANDFDVQDTLELSTNGETTKELGAKPNPEDATNVSFSYSSSSDEVATVDKNGVVTAVANGECDITVRMEQKNPTKVEVVSEYGESVDEPETQDTDTQEVSPVEEAAPDVGVESAGANPSEEEPSNEEQPSDGEPTVNLLDVPNEDETSEGVVIEKTVHVVVTTAVEDITLNNNEGILTVGNTYTIKATVTPENATDKTVTWNSGDENVATVDANGKVSAKAVGTAVVTAKAGDKSAEYKLTVQQVKCSYCGKTGHTSSNCPQKVADQQAKAAQQAAAQAAAQQAAQQAAAAPSDSGSNNVGSSGGGESAPAPSAPESSSNNDSGWTPPPDGSNGWVGSEIIPGGADKSCPPEQMGIACGF